MRPALLAVLLTLPALAQRVAIDASLRSNEKPYIQAIGEATITARPDQAILEVEVVTQASNSAAATTQNAKKARDVLTQLHTVLGPADQVKTRGFRVTPVRDTVNGSTKILAGYTVSNTLEVKINDLTRVGKIIDAATQAGANSIHSLNYEFRNPGAVRGQALKQAAANAKASAEAIAEGLGLKIVRILAAEDYVPEDGGYMKKVATPLPANQQTPIEVKDIEVTAAVLLRAEVN